MSSLDRQLETACALVQALLDQADAGAAPIEPDELARRRSAARALLHQSPVPTAVVGLDRRVELLNHAWHVLFERFGLAEPAIAPAIAAAVDQVGATRARVHLAELELKTATLTGYCTMTLEPRRGPAGDMIGVIAVCADVTDAVTARQLGLPPDSLVWTGDPSGLGNHANEAWKRYTGHSGSSRWIEVIHPDDRARCAHALGEARRRRTSIEVEARLRRHDGTYRWHRARFTSHGPRQWLGAALDVHDARNMEIERDELASRERAARADAEQANRLKDQFLAAVSHELRSPLTTMLLWEKVLRDETADPELHRHALDAIHQSAELQSRLVADLLDVSRAISGKLYVDLRPVEIASVLAEAVEAIAPEMAQKQIELASHVDPSVGVVHIDAVRIRQVLDNLLSNASKFTDPGGRVDVSLSRSERSIVLEIADTGRGIAKELLPGLFNPFNQGDDALTRSQGGLGLGLAIAHQLVTLHHGTLTATSPGRGQGATFTVILPAVGARRASTPPAGLRARSLERVRVLIVDDDPRVRDALALLLRRAGAIIATAASADEARQQITAVDPMILICDIAMPGEDGYEFIRRLRASGIATPAIALTALARDTDARDAYEAGFDEHVAKPVDFDRLVATISDLLPADDHTPDGIA